ncbi:calcium-independent phospholipase A2-gamma-like [Helicoverpa armigera]|uniref:calcium-independent phospholipase A2-gamma-like n=1 Tax=Helicoverpa armigera TaxID=29058 RepID=UPI003082E5BA
MSSLGGQWRVIRHYLSLSNLNAEVEKLVQKLKPATPDQWDNLIQKFEKAVSARLSGQVAAGADTDKTEADAKPNNAAAEDTNSKAVKPASEPKPRESTGSELSVEGLLQGLRLKKDTQLGKISQPTWKEQKSSVSKSSIASRTAYVIGAVSAAASRDSVLRRAERLVEHLHEFPEARDYAIKEGAVRALLRVQDSLDHAEPLAKEIDGVVNEALALVGYCGPPRGPGANILALDGGGIRGIIAIEMLRHLERLSGRRVTELFDYVAGVSTGAIIAAVLCGGAGTLDSARHMYYTLSQDMFGNTSLLGGGARLVWTHAYYDTQAWERLLQDNLRDVTLTHCNRSHAPKLAIVSCVVNRGSRLAPFLFRSYEVGWRRRSVFPGTSRAPLWAAVRASAAAPTYFDEFRHDGLLHQDGGILVNNPAAVAVHEARLLFGAAAVARGSLVSLGTGRALSAHTDYRRLTSALADRQQPTSWRDKFNKILDSATDTEGVHLVMNDLFPAGGYFRFNPPLMQDCAMDEIDKAKLDNLVVDTHAYIRRNQHKFEQAAAQLCRRRGLLQRVTDAAKRQAILAGIAD